MDYIVCFRLHVRSSVHLWGFNKTILENIALQVYLTIRMQSNLPELVNKQKNQHWMKIWCNKKMFLSTIRCRSSQIKLQTAFNKLEISITHCYVTVSIEVSVWGHMSITTTLICWNHVWDDKNIRTIGTSGRIAQVFHVGRIWPESTFFSLNILLKCDGW